MGLRPAVKRRGQALSGRTRQNYRPAFNGIATDDPDIWLHTFLLPLVRITAQLLMGFSIEEEIFPPRVFIEYKLVEILECLTYKPNGVLM